MLTRGRGGNSYPVTAAMGEELASHFVAELWLREVVAMGATDGQNFLPKNDPGRSTLDGAAAGRAAVRDPVKSSRAEGARQADSITA